jgi:transcriptional regulator with XRE-family HTH domain
MNFGKRVQELLGVRGIPLRGVKSELARTCEVSYQAVSQWFSGETVSIKNEHLVAIALEFGTTTDWLLTGEGEMLPGLSGVKNSAPSPSLTNENHENKGDTAFAERVQLAKKHVKLHQQGLARQVGCTQHLIAKAERGVRPTRTAMIQIAMVCKVSECWLSTGEGSMSDVTQDAAFDTFDRAGNYLRIFPLVEDMTLADEMPHGFLIPASWIPNGERLRHRLRLYRTQVNYHHGDFSKGDMVLVDVRDDTLENGCSYAIQSHLSDEITLCFFIKKSHDNWIYFVAKPGETDVMVICNDESRPKIIGRVAGKFSMDFYKSIPL